jgi:hypothetical protein
LSNLAEGDDSQPENTQLQNSHDVLQENVTNI